jgi:hypothetical protein
MTAAIRFISVPSLDHINQQACALVAMKNGAPDGIGNILNIGPLFSKNSKFELFRQVFSRDLYAAETHWLSTI